MAMSTDYESGMAYRMRVFPVQELPKTVAGRVEFVNYLLRGQPIVDDNGDETGEYGGPLISVETAKRLLEGC